MTLNDMLTEIDIQLPNTLSIDTKISFINNAQRQIFKYMNELDMYTFTTIADQGTYAMPTDCTADLIKQVFVTSTTEVVTANTSFSEYNLSGRKDELAGHNSFYDAWGELGLYPVPDKTGYSVRMIYYKRPFIFATSDTGVSFNINEDYLDYIKVKTMANIAVTGSYPDSETRNNYEADAKELEKKLKLDYYNKKVKIPDHIISYKEGWNS